MKKNNRSRNKLKKILIYMTKISSYKIYTYLYWQQHYQFSSVTQLCLTLCKPMDCSLPGSSIYGILQARIVPFPSPGDLPNPGIKQTSPALAGRFFTTERPGKYPSYLSAIELKDRENSKLVISQLLLETKGAHNHSNLVQFTSACINA